MTQLCGTDDDLFALKAFSSNKFASLVCYPDDHEILLFFAQSYVTFHRRKIRET